MDYKRINKISTIFAILGLVLLGIVILFNISYPNPLFSILITIGLGFVLISTVLYSIAWLLNIRSAVIKKEYLEAILVALMGVIIIVLFVLKQI